MRERRTRVLYVEDAPDLRALILAALDVNCFRVVVAPGVDAAQFLASRERFDAVLCGHATTARSLHEFICGRPTRLFVLRSADGVTLPPRAVVLHSPTAAELRQALAHRRSSAS